MAGRLVQATDIENWPGPGSLTAAAVLMRSDDVESPEPSTPSTGEIPNHGPLPWPPSDLPSVCHCSATDPLTAGCWYRPSAAARKLLHGLSCAAPCFTQPAADRSAFETPVVVPLEPVQGGGGGAAAGGGGGNNAELAAAVQAQLQQAQLDWDNEFLGGDDDGGGEDVW